MNIFVHPNHTFELAVSLEQLFSHILIYINLSKLFYINAKWVYKEMGIEAI